MTRGRSTATSTEEAEKHLKPGVSLQELEAFAKEMTDNETAEQLNIIIPDQPMNQPLQQQRENLCASTIRALSGRADLHFRAHRLYQGERGVPAHSAHLQLTPGQDSREDLRGIGDGLALRLLHSDAALHRQLSPAEPLQQLIFEWLEQLRCEALPPAHWPGVAHNLHQRFEQWSLKFHDAGLTSTALGLLLYTLTQMVWSRLNNCPVLEATEDLLEATRAGIAPLMGTDLAGLKRTRHDQQAYAVHALAIASRLQTLLAAEQEIRIARRSQRDDDDITRKLLLMLNIGDTREQGFAQALSGAGRLPDEQVLSYRVFTRRYDRIASPARLVRAELLRELRHTLDEHRTRQRINIHPLVRQLQHLFAEPQRDGWSFGEEEGHIDGSRLSQLLTSPQQHRLFKQEAQPPRSHACVTFLLDCSGSMKAHAEPIALLLDTFSRALEQAGVHNEILGFTTNRWNGGRALQDWRQAGKPARPGRLNETCHLIYKDADTPWRRARPALAALLKTDLYREGIDGEAVEWACERLHQQEVKRRLLVVISDGCPMDSATQLANDTFYLDHHLQQVIAHHTARGIDIYGLGVGLDLSQYYRRHLAIDLSSGLNNGLLTGLVQLWAARS